MGEESGARHHDQADEQAVFDKILPLFISYKISHHITEKFQFDSPAQNLTGIATASRLLKVSERLS